MSDRPGPSRREFLASTGALLALPLIPGAVSAAVAAPKPPMMSELIDRYNAIRYHALAYSCTWDDVRLVTVSKLLRQSLGLTGDVLYEGTSHYLSDHGGLGWRIFPPAGYRHDGTPIDRSDEELVALYGLTPASHVPVPAESRRDYEQLKRELIPLPKGVAEWMVARDARLRNR